MLLIQFMDSLRKGRLCLASSGHTSEPRYLLWMGSLSCRAKRRKSILRAYDRKSARMIRTLLIWSDYAMRLRLTIMPHREAIMSTARRAMGVLSPVWGAGALPGVWLRWQIATGLPSALTIVHISWP